MSVLVLDDIHRTFHIEEGVVHAVNGVSLEIGRGETLGLIGESGSGKSTIGRIALGLIAADSGRVVFAGHDLRTIPPRRLRELRARMQIVFQEPLESLNPQMTVLQTVEEPLRIHRRDLTRAQRRAAALATLAEAKLDPMLNGRYPSELSGGQQQRVGIARAIVTQPDLVVLDEPTSSLDLTIRAQILRLLRDLQQRHDLAYLFISHDLTTVQAISHRVAVLYLGHVVETGPADVVATDPKHPYTQALLSATLSVDPREQTDHYPLTGEPPGGTESPTGCVLCGRCPIEIPDCATDTVPLHRVGPNHEVACIRTGHL